MQAGSPQSLLEAAAVAGKSLLAGSLPDGSSAEKVEWLPFLTFSTLSCDILTS